MLDHPEITAQSVTKIKDGWLLTGSSVKVNPPGRPVKFYRHGWQSWSLAAWIDASVPPVPIRSAELKMKDEDPIYADSRHHVSAWVGALEFDGDLIILLGGLGLSARVEYKANRLHGFYEAGGGEWFLGIGTEAQVFSRYAELLGKTFGQQPVNKAPRVWCSWYSLYSFVNESSINKVLNGLDKLPFDVIQIDDGWGESVGDWLPNKKFPSGLAALVKQITNTGRKAGIWLAPFLVTKKSSVAKNHPEWLLKDENDQPRKAGLSWNGTTYALDSSHPGVLDHLEKVMIQLRETGFEYFKLDFLYTGALPGVRHQNIPREQAYRQALERIRRAAGVAYILACGAPIIPSLGLCDGIRVGPDMTPYWINTPMSIWLNNPSHPGAWNAIRTSLNRLWLQPLIHTDPDVVYFRSRYNSLTSGQNEYLKAAGAVSKFIATSDLPIWLTEAEKTDLAKYLEQAPSIHQTGRYLYEIDGKRVDFNPVMPIPSPRNVPAKLGIICGLYNMLIQELLPAYLASREK
jgi:alpha-galactosidase